MAKSSRTALLLALFFLSGATGLIYELVWTRQLVFLFGGTTYAITTVLVAFMAGLGAGSYFAGRFAGRLTVPGRAYGLLEILIGLYALAIPWILQLADPLYRTLYPGVAEYPGFLTACRFIIGCFVLLFPTTLMGATLPLLVQQLTSSGTTVGTSVGRLFGLNTLGAFVGTALAGFWLLPALGLTLTTRLAAAVNVAIGLTAWLLFRTTAPSLTVSAARKTQVSLPVHGADESSAHGLILAAFALSGFCSMVYQIAWTRALIVSLGSTTYAFTCILSAFIAGLALGSLTMSRWVDRWSRPLQVMGALQLGIGLLAVFIVPIHGRVPTLVHHIVVAHHSNYDAVLALEFLLVTAVTFLPTFLLGCLWPIVTRLASRSGSDAASTTGRVYVINTFGTVLGSFLTGFVLIRGEVLGAQNSIIAAAILNACMGGLLISKNSSRPSRDLPRWLWPIASGAFVFVIAVAFGRWDRQLLTSAPFLRHDQSTQAELVHRVLFYQDGVDLTAAVTAWPGQGGEFIALSVNGKSDASTDINDMTTQLLTAHIPAFLDRAGRVACVVGLGSGMTLGGVAVHRNYERIDCAELSNEVIRASEYFAPYTHDVLNNKRVRLVHADGRNHLLLTPDTYDLIVSEPSNPWIAGVANLFTREFFDICKGRLKPDGILCVWLQGYRMSVDGFKTVTRTLHEVFPAVSIWELSAGQDYLFVAARQPIRIPLQSIDDRLTHPDVLADLNRIGIGKVEQLLGRFITGGEPLRAWAAGALVNTDDNALLEFAAPKSIYLSEEMELAKALHAIAASPFAEWVVPDPSLPRHQRIVDRSREIAKARSLRWLSWEAWSSGQIAAALQSMLDAFQLDPDNIQVFQTLGEFRLRIKFEAPHLERDSKISFLLALIEQLQPPHVADKSVSPALSAPRS